jgi:hypothetical protein
MTKEHLKKDLGFLAAVPAGEYELWVAIISSIM